MASHLSGDTTTATAIANGRTKAAPNNPGDLAPSTWQNTALSNPTQGSGSNIAQTNFRSSQRRAAGRRSADPRSQKPAAHVAPAITELELSGRLERHPGGLLARIHNH
ncbi:hypothetical protein [uncultured Planktomarina sp.]|uniref:DprA-like winged helix domain-containing protein n=1 Tax=uncultured Planktomarina sp. TaxID=1538529 RepID=UPI00326038BB